MRWKPESKDLVFALLFAVAFAVALAHCSSANCWTGNGTDFLLSSSLIATFRILSAGGSTAFSPAGNRSRRILCLPCCSQLLLPLLQRIADLLALSTQNAHSRIRIEQLRWLKKCDESPLAAASSCHRRNSRNCRPCERSRGSSCAIDGQRRSIRRNRCCPTQCWKR